MAWARPGTSLCRKHASAVALTAPATPAVPAAAPATPAAALVAPAAPALVPAPAPATQGTGDRVPAAKGKGKSKGKIKGTGKGGKEHEAANESKVTFKSYDFVDPSWLKEFGSMPLSAYAPCIAPEPDDEFVPEESCTTLTLRQVCCQMLERLDVSNGEGIESWFKADVIPQMLGVKGRRFGGIGLKDMTEEEQQLLKHLRFSSGYHATRPCFTFGKLAKELLRGGFECDDMVRD